MTGTLFQTILTRMDKFENDKSSQEQLKQKGQCVDGKWHYEAWSPDLKKLAITSAEPMESRMIKDTLDKILNIIRLNPGCVKIFKASRPLTGNMSGGPVRVMIQFSIKSPAELFKMLDSLVQNTIFELVNADFQHHSLVRSPLAIQVGNYPA